MLGSDGRGFSTYAGHRHLLEAGPEIVAEEAGAEKPPWKIRSTRYSFVVVVQQIMPALSE
jgi:hypothetical protein